MPHGRMVMFGIRRRGFSTMKGENLEKWQKLCQAAVGERDHVRLMELIREIDQMLLEKELRLQSTKPNATSDKRAA